MNEYRKIAINAVKASRGGATIRLTPTELRKRLAHAEALLRRLLAIHALDYSKGVTAEAYPGAQHEEAEESLCVEVVVFLAESEAVPEAVQP